MQTFLLLTRQKGYTGNWSQTGHRSDSTARIVEMRNEEGRKFPGYDYIIGKIVPVEIKPSVVIPETVEEIEWP